MFDKFLLCQRKCNSFLYFPKKGRKDPLIFTFSLTQIRFLKKKKQYKISVTPQQVEELIRAAMQNSQNNFMQQIQNLTQQLQELQPPQIVILHPITIQRNIPSGDCTLHLIKSLPEFSGDNNAYHAWRAAAKFAMEY